jgi:hypothetical protein
MIMNGGSLTLWLEARILQHIRQSLIRQTCLVISVFVKSVGDALYDALAFVLPYQEPLCHLKTALNAGPILAVLLSVVLAPLYHLLRFLVVSILALKSIFHYQKPALVQLIGQGYHHFLWL